MSKKYIRELVIQEFVGVERVFRVVVLSEELDRRLADFALLATFRAR